MLGEKWTETLRCELTEPEVRDRADQAARAFGEAAESEDELTAIATEMRGQIKRLRAQVAELLRSVRERSEYRPVECAEAMNAGGSEPARVDIVRTDTGEIVRSRQLTPDERQLGFLPQEDSGAGPA